MFTALSGLQTASKIVEVSANNVANAGSLGFVRNADGTDNGGFRPERVQSVSLPGGGVTGRAVPIDPASVRIYQPDNADADEAGFVPVPNVDLAEEFVTQILARNAYAASAQLIREENDRYKELLGISS